MSRVLKKYENLVTNRYGNGHGGIDVVGEGYALDSIIAHSDGTVVWCQSGIPNDKGSGGNRSYGNAVKLRHENGYYTLYAHMQYIDVRNGQKVNCGDKIGFMGDTGNSYGAHLHFEVRNTSDYRVDPAQYIDNDLPNLQQEDDDKSYDVYVVQSGDTLYAIAQDFDTTIDELVRLNGIENPNLIFVGQELKVREDKEEKYETGKYKVVAEVLNVRTGAGTNYRALNFAELTENAQEQNLKLCGWKCNGFAKGLICDITEISEDKCWGKTFSGWVCLDYCVKQ